jgi:hypothetical protein
MIPPDLLSHLPLLTTLMAAFLATVTVVAKLYARHKLVKMILKHAKPEQRAEILHAAVPVLQSKRPWRRKIKRYLRPLSRASRNRSARRPQGSHGR